MSASKGQHSYNTFICWAPYGTANPGGGTVGTVPGAFTRLEEVVSINGLPMNPSVTRLTHLGSDDKAQEKIPGFLDAGQITFRVNNSSDVLSALVQLMPDGTEVGPDWGRKQFIVQFPDSSQWYATAFVQGMPFEVPEDDRNTVEVTLEVSGRPTFNQA